MKYLLIILLVFSSPVLLFSQKSNTANELIDKIKGLKEIQFNLSMPALDDSKDVSANWPIKYILIITDTSLQKACDNYTYSKKIIPDLIKMLNSSDFDWIANVFLYSITKTNAIEMVSYYPSNITAWRQERKSKDIAMWHTYFTQLKK